MGADHEIRSLGGAEQRTRTPEPTDAPKRMDWLRVTPFDCWKLRNTMWATIASAAPTAADVIIFLPRDPVQASHSPRERLCSYTPHPTTRRLSAITPNPPTVRARLNRAQSKRQVSSARRVNSTAASGLPFGLLALKRVQDASKSHHTPSSSPPEGLFR